MTTKRDLQSAFIRWVNEKNEEIAQIEDWEEKRAERKKVDRIVRIFMGDEKIKNICWRCEEDAGECGCCKCDGSCRTCKEAEYRSSVL